MKVSERYRWRRIGRKILLAALILILGGIFVFGQRGLFRWYRLIQISKNMAAHNDSLEAAIEDLSGQIRSLEEGDTLELERRARELGMVRPGEEVYLIQDEADTLESANTP
jgi:cell division protein FtsB